jgi:hypothetical protein
MKSVKDIHELMGVDASIISPKRTKNIIFLNIFYFKIY